MAQSTSGRVSGKVAIVTGAATGIGAAVAKPLADQGATVVVADVQDDLAARTAAEIGDAAVVERLDVTRADLWNDLVTCVDRDHGPVSVLLNNAGIVHNKLMETLDEADYRKVVDVNQVWVFLGTKAVVPSMRRAAGGSIVNISSIGGIIAYQGVMGYIASKWAVRGMSKAAAQELGKYGIRVNSVHQGVIETPMTVGTGASDTTLNQLLAFSGSPQGIANMVLFLASDESNYATGAEFIVDGGYTSM